MTFDWLKAEADAVAKRTNDGADPKSMNGF